MLNVDSHFHPNFSFALPEPLLRLRAKRLWKAFAKHELDVVFISEHVFKQPARSYAFLEQCRPTSAKTMLIPAVEAVSEEGVEVIVFSKNEHLYTREDIMTPYALPLDELIRRIHNDPQLHGILVHPFLPGRNSVINHRTLAEVQEIIGTVGSVEMYNASPLGMMLFLKTFRMEKLCGRTLNRLRLTASASREICQEGTLIFGGSDAHHPWAVGTHLELDIDPASSRDQLFDALLSPAVARKISWRPVTRWAGLLGLLIDTLTVAKEVIKKRNGWYSIDATYFGVEEEVGEFVPELSLMLEENGAGDSVGAR